jgi:shikimate kinase
VGSGWRTVDSQENERSEATIPGAQPGMPAHCPLFLIGSRATGKSTVAQLLAKRIGWSWLDADTVLEQRAGQSIREIFAAGGEATFRELEATILGEMCQLQGHVIATGGGVILRADNRQRLKQHGRVVWLTCHPATLWARLHADPATRARRPDLGEGGLAEVEELLRLREPWYAECAHLIVDTTARSPAQVADAILDHWARGS